MRESKSIALEQVVYLEPTGNLARRINKADLPLEATVVDIGRKYFYVARSKNGKVESRWNIRFDKMTMKDANNWDNEGYNLFLSREEYDAHVELRRKRAAVLEAARSSYKWNDEIIEKMYAVLVDTGFIKED